MEYVVAILILLLRGLVWGVVVNMVIQKKGNHENWFWWGFFFGEIVIIIALLRPRYKMPVAQTALRGEQNKIQQKLLNKKLLEQGGWECPCGRVNAHYVTTCPCGANRRIVISEHTE